MLTADQRFAGRPAESVGIGDGEQERESETHRETAQTDLEQRNGAGRTVQVPASRAHLPRLVGDLLYAKRCLAFPERQLPHQQPAERRFERRSKVPGGQALFRTTANNRKRKDARSDLREDLQKSKQGAGEMLISC